MSLGAHTPSDAREIMDADLSALPRDVLEFNHRQLAKSFVSWHETLEEQHKQDMDALRRLIGVGQRMAVIIDRARRAGRKTVRVAEVLAEATAQDAEAGRYALTAELVYTTDELETP